MNKGKKTSMDISGKRWNDIINAVNGKRSPESIKPPLDDVELKEFKRMAAKKAKFDAKESFPLIFENVEYEADDPCLDIYND